MARFLGLRGARLTTAISTVCGLCFLCYGYTQGVMGSLLTVPAFLSQFPQVDTLGSRSFHTAWVTGLTVGAWNLGCIISSILAIFISDYLGRRRTLLIGISIWTIGEIIQTTSYSFPQFVVGRAVAGFGNGFTTATVPAYQAECVKSHRKGTILMVSTGAFVAFGYALSYWLVFGFSYAATSSAAWRAPIALQILFALPAIIMLFVLPESPRWLILTGREQEALTVLVALNDAEPDSPEIRDEFLQIKDAILVMASASSSNMFSNRDRRGFHRIVLAYGIQIFAQGTGINLVLQYLSWIFLTRMGFSGWLSRLLASCSATTYFIASFIAVVGIDRFWGRRSLMIFGACGMSGCMILITITQYLWTEQDISAGRVASTVFVFVFSVFFAIGWQGMAWLYQVEIVPLRIRGPANALSTKVNWMINALVVIITPIAFHNIGYRTWIIFACTNLAIIPLVYFFYPETAYRSLEEVDVIFYLADEAPGNPWLNAVRISLHEPLWFGKRGEKRFNFDYANSSWHRRLMETTSSGSGSGSGSNEKPAGAGHGNNAPDTGHRPRTPHSSGSDTVVTDSITKKRTRSESLVDPRMHTASYSTDTSPESTMTTTITAQENNSKRSLRETLHRSFSREKMGNGEGMNGAQKQRTFNPYTVQHQSNNSRTSLEDDSVQVGRFSPETDSSWWTSDLAPAPLRISRPQSEVGHDQNDADDEDEAAPDIPRHRSQTSLHRRQSDSDTRSFISFSYPGRLRTGLKRSESGNSETYYPDGIEPDVDDVSGDRGSETRSRSGKHIARDAGRAY